MVSRTVVKCHVNVAAVGIQRLAFLPDNDRSGHFLRIPCSIGYGINDRISAGPGRVNLACDGHGIGEITVRIICCGIAGIDIIITLGDFDLILTDKNDLWRDVILDRDHPFGFRDISAAVGNSIGDAQCTVIDRFRVHFHLIRQIAVDRIFRFVSGFFEQCCRGNSNIRPRLFQCQFRCCRVCDMDGPRDLVALFSIIGQAVSHGIVAGRTVVHLSGNDQLIRKICIADGSRSALLLILLRHLQRNLRRAIQSQDRLFIPDIGKSVSYENAAGDTDCSQQHPKKDRHRAHSPASAASSV